MANAAGIEKLTERQKEILRLLLAGHDAKSAARELGISVHTINEHLRDVRRKLGASSSREAARILGATELIPPNSLGSQQLRVADAAAERFRTSRAIRNKAVAFGGILLVILALSAFAMSVIHPASAVPTDVPPRVNSTQPRNGSQIHPGPFTLMVTFDRPMLDRNFSFVEVSPETYPSCEQPPRLSADARSFSMHCTAIAGHSYEIWFNRPPYMNFKSLTGTPAEPYELRFSTSSR
ncbi:MAG TPA: helix-turn-helix transcriptional regulator [Sphingomicrobium sp.]|nr:helix-turn-helix transcriptional regulator [Sphingomicrobium sp.]